jgi:hypothetical protein
MPGSFNESAAVLLAAFEIINLQICGLRSEWFECREPHKHSPDALPLLFLSLVDREKRGRSYRHKR